MWIRALRSLMRAQFWTRQHAILSLAKPSTTSGKYLNSHASATCQHSSISYSKLYLVLHSECCLPDDDRWLDGPTVHPMTYYGPPAEPTAWQAPCVGRFREIGRNIMFVAGDLVVFMTSSPAYVLSKRASAPCQVSSYRLSLSIYQTDPNITCLPYGA